GMLLRINNQSLVITAAHVIKNLDLQTVQLVTTNHPSDVRSMPEMGDLYGGNFNEDLDVAFLRIKDVSTPLLAGKRFIGLEDLDFFPLGLKTDAGFAFGFPWEEHREQSPDVHAFGSFGVFCRFPAD